MTIDWNHELIEQLDFHWKHFVRPRLDDLTDDEYLWEPVPGMWSLRPRGDATSGAAAGAGDTVADFEFPEPSPAPVTTIAWRMAHISIGVFGMRASNHLPPDPAHHPLPDVVDYRTTDWPLTAEGGLALLDHHHRAWPCGPSEGPYAQYPMASLILHISREAIHHSAEIMLLRDLYRRRDELGQTAGTGTFDHHQGASR